MRNIDKDKQSALEIALERIEKDHGKGAVMRLGEISDQLATESIPTGSLALDMALGIGGIPRGRVTEIFGAESAGKSTLAIHIMAETQKAGGIAAYVRSVAPERVAAELERAEGYAVEYRVFDWSVNAQEAAGG